MSTLNALLAVGLTTVIVLAFGAGVLAHRAYDKCKDNP